MERPSEAVLLDVLAGLVSEASACADYGVVLCGAGMVDERSTATRRGSDSPRPIISVPAFNFGSGRRSLESRWPPEVQNLLHAELLSWEVGLRDWLKHRAYATWQERSHGSAGSYRQEFLEVWQEVVTALSGPFEMPGPANEEGAQLGDARSS